MVGLMCGRSVRWISDSVFRVLYLSLRKKATPRNYLQILPNDVRSQARTITLYRRHSNMAEEATGYSPLPEGQSHLTNGTQMAPTAADGAAVEEIVRNTVTVSALGTTFDVVYREWWNKSEKFAEDFPSVVCIHGAPATDSTFRTIGGPIAAKGYRVIAVNNPGMGYTELDPEHKYDHSPVHKAEVVKGLIRALNIKKVAMLIGHSMGGHVAGLISADPEMEDIIQSVCFLCGPGTRPHRTHKSAHVVSFLPALVYSTMYIPVLGWLVISICSRLVTRLGLRGKTPEAQVLSIYEVHQLDFDAFAKARAQIADSKMPVLVMYARDDIIIEGAIAEENMVVLGIGNEDTVYYDEEGKTEDSFKGDSLRRAVCFATGSHRVAIKRPEPVAKEMISFLEAQKKHLQAVDK